MKAKILFGIILAAAMVSCAPSATSTLVPPTPSVIIESTATLVPVQKAAAPVSACGESVLVSPDIRAITSETQRITLQIPADWKCDDTGDQFEYSGADGFFRIIPGYLPASSAKEVCETQARQSVGKGQNLYGANPVVEITQVDNQPACLVMPSDGQKHSGSLLVVEYPFKYPEYGKNSTRVLWLLADENHIRDFIVSLKFIRAKP
jgi:hypothetical protein